VKKAKTYASGSKNGKAKQTTASEKAKGRTQTGKMSESLVEAKDSAEECADDDDESKTVEDKKTVKQTQEKTTKLGKLQQKLVKSKADESKDEGKSDKSSAEQSKQSKVSMCNLCTFISDYNYYNKKNNINNTHICRGLLVDVTCMECRCCLMFDCCLFLFLKLRSNCKLFLPWYLFNSKYMTMIS